MDKLRLYGSPGTGSAIVEAALNLAGRRFAAVDIAYGADGPDLAALQAVNPAGQLPALVLPNGVVMTESAAILLFLSEAAPEAGLAPLSGDSDRPEFLRWLLFLAANLYPTFTYADFPGRWVSDKGAQAELVARIENRRKELWTIVDNAAAGPWFLGRRFSALDLFIWVMAHWRPRRRWFAECAPTLAAVADALDKDARLDCVRLRHFHDASAENRADASLFKV
ncbi:MAG: glutathione S-transferase [Parvularculaceae bacterium]